jgi:hypothetical protein
MLNQQAIRPESVSQSESRWQQECITQNYACLFADYAVPPLDSDTEIGDTYRSSSTHWEEQQPANLYGHIFKFVLFEYLDGFGLIECE